MQVRVLGPVELVDDDGSASVPLGGRRPVLLLAMLAARAGTLTRSSELVEALWGDQLPADPTGALQSQISRLRRRLGPNGRLETVAEGYRLAAEMVDGARFEQLVIDAASAAGSAEALALLDEALSLWRGPPFGELGDHPALVAAATRLGELHRLAAERRVDALLGVGQADRAVIDAQTLADDHPYREEPWGLLMRALAATGRHADALGAYQRFRRRLAEDLGLDPSPELRAAEASILRHESGGISTRGGARPARLPCFGTSFVGREDERAMLAELLSRARLVSVVGPGGVGKTRLAVETAAQMVDRYPDGVFFVDLTAARLPAEFAQVVASILQIERRAERTTLERIVEALSPLRALVVLDNCEHVLDPAAELADAVVAGTDSVDILATSRERIGLASEHCTIAEPLPVPAGTAADAPAVRLFADRARAVRPSLTFDEPTLKAACELCRRLAGLPLAIELAAAQMAARTTTQILADLDAAGGWHLTRRGAERHRSMEAVVEWSYRLLDDDARALFDRLAVFAGGFEADAAASVAAAPIDSTTGLLDELAARSMITALPSAAATRYSLLEPIRAVASDHLCSAGLDDDTRARHARWYLQLAEAADAGLRGVDERDWATRLFLELANLRAAHRWFLDADDPDRAIRLSASLFWFGWLGANSEVAGWAEETAHQYAESEHRLLSTVYAAAAAGAWQQGDLARSRALAERGIAASGPDRSRARLALEALGDAVGFSGQFDRALEYYVEAETFARAAGDDRQALMDLGNQAMMLAYTGDFEAALHRADATVEIAGRTQSPSDQALANYFAGEVRLDVDPVGALVRLEHALSHLQGGLSRFVAGVAGLSAASVQARVGDPAQALTRFLALLTHWQQLGAWNQQWLTIRVLIETLVRAGRDEPAAVLHGALTTSPTAAPLAGPDAERHSRAVGVLRQHLGDAGFERLAAYGTSLSDEAAVAYAIETLDQPRTPADGA